MAERRGGTSKFYHGDYLNSITRETDSAQATTATKQYDAFGMPLSSTGSSASPFGFAGCFGYQEDGDSGLKLLGHRYYDPSTGRFLTRDPAKDGRNWYGYCGNDPLGSVDPSGLWLNWKEAWAYIATALSYLNTYFGIPVSGRQTIPPPAKPKAPISWRGPENPGDGGDGKGGGSGRGKWKWDPDVLKKILDHIGDPVEPVEIPDYDLTGEGWKDHAKKAVVAVGVAVALWEVGKWGIAIFTAPETGGASLAIAAACP